MTRSEYWELHCDGRIDVPRMNFLRDALMQRDPRRVSKGRVEIFNHHYRHEDLIEYDGKILDVAWDGADLSHVFVIAETGLHILAEREPINTVGDPKSLADHREWRGKVKGKLQAIDAAAEVVAAEGETYQSIFDKRLWKHQKRQPPIQFLGQQIDIPGSPVRFIAPKKERESDTPEFLDLIRGAARAKAERVP